MSNTQVTPAPLSFTFATLNLRAVLLNDEPWFVAADVCAALDYAHTPHAMRMLDDDEKGVHILDTLGGKQSLAIINESGLYSLILGSRKPEAKRFKKWVTSEVLPAIRKSGSYTHAPEPPTQPRPTLTNAQQEKLQTAILHSTCGWVFSDKRRDWVYNHLRVAFGVARWQDIPERHFGTAMAMIEDKKFACEDFLSFMNEARRWFEQEVLGGKSPWTPAIKAQMSKELGESITLPREVDWIAIAQQQGRIQ